jgi:hypothetical protein
MLELLMGTFLKIFFAIVLWLLGVFVLISSFLGFMFFGGAGFIVQIIVAIALIAGAITLSIKVRR